MRYDDASQAGSMASDTAPVARPDVDTLPPGSYGPASGNAITGAGTATGTSGADTPGTIVEVHGAGGPTSGSGNAFQATGQFGVLNMDAQGNFSYARNSGTPDGVQDVFGYTLADASGATASTTLTIDIGKDQAQVTTIPGIVNLPPGVELSDITVSGRDLIIHMPDGSQMVIPGGAVFVPQLVIGDVQVPPSNLAALLIESEPQPAAGGLQSSGGNFDVPVPPLDPGVPLGDLIPPTELAFTPPDFEEVGQFEDTEPEISIQPDGQPAAVNAIDDVNEKGLPPRGVEPQGSGEEAAAGDNGDTSEATTGVIHITAEDGVQSITINGVTVTGAVGQTIPGDFGTLTITGFLPNGDIQYSYVLTDNTIGDTTHDDFSVTLTDTDGDTATATLRIDIIDDVPTARNDTDTVDLQSGTATGNVVTGDGTTNGAAGRDTSGADGVHNETNGAIDGVTGVHPGGGSGAFTAVPQDGSGVTVIGTFGDLTIHNDGSYTYTLHEGAEGGGTDVFTYQLTDGDGDTSTATLTINNPDQTPSAETPPEVFLDDDALPGGIPGGVGDQDPDTENTHGFLTGTGGDGDLDFFFSASQSGLPTGFTANLVDSSHLEISQNGTHVLTVELNNETGEYTVTQVAPLTHPDGGNENDIGDINVSFFVQDADGDHSDPAFLTINVDDDTPDAVADAEPTLPQLIVDESPLSGDGDNSDTENFAGAFASVLAFGADGPAAVLPVQYDLVLSSEGAGSGLFALDPTDTNPSGGFGKGAEIQLFTNGDTIEGRVGSDVYFTISVDNDGNVTLTRNPDLNLWHAVNPNPDDAQILTAAAGTLQLQQTLTDADQDSDSAVVDLSSGVFRFEDDGPDAHNDSGNVNEGGTLIVNAASGVLSNDDFGTDGPGAITGVVKGTDTSNPIVNGNVGVQIDGDFGKLTLNADGSYTYVSTDGLVPPDGATDTFVYTIRDADGDTDTVTLTIHLSDVNKFPNADDVTAKVDDDGLSGGNTPGGTGDIDANAGEVGSGTSSEAVWTGTLSGGGGDAPTHFLFNESLEAIHTDTLGTETLEYVVSPDGLTLQAFVDGGARDGTLLFDIVITNASTGAYTLTLHDNVLHAPGGNDETSDTLSIPYQIADVNNDTDTANINITFNDDTPTATAIHLTGTVDEDGVREGASDSGPGDGIAGGPGDIVGEVTQVNGNVSTLFSAGADSPLTYNINASVASLTAQNLTSNGVALSYNVAFAAGVYTLTASAPGGNTIFTFTLNASTGAYQFNLVDQLDHPTLNGMTGDNTENDLTILLGSMIQATDADGDKVTASADGLDITVNDDSPTLGTIDDGTANNNPGAAHSFGDLNFEVGADEPASVTNITLTTEATSGGKAIVTHFDPVTGVLTAYQDVGVAGFHAGEDTTVVFTLTVDPNAGSTGQWDFDLVTPLDVETVDTPIGGSSSFGAGPTLGQILEDAVGNPLSVVSGYFTQAAFDFDTWKAGGGVNATTVDPGGVNGSTDGWGIPNNNFDGSNELMIFDFGDEALTDWDGGDAFAPPVGTSLPQISFATFEFKHYSSGAGNAGDDIAYVVHYVTAAGVAAGSATGFVPDASIDGALFTLTAPAGLFIADVQFFTGIEPDGTTVQDVGPGKVDLVSVGVTTTSINQDLDFTVHLSDRDGDEVSGSFTVNVADGNTPSTLAATTLASTSSLSDSSFDSSTLFASNDNGGHGHQTQKAFANGSNAVLMGALAAAGLSGGEHLGSIHHAADDPISSNSSDFTVASTASVTSETESSSKSSDTESKLLGDTQKSSGDAPQQGTQSHNDDSGHDKGVSNEQADAQAPADLPQGTEAPAHDGGSTPVTAAAIVMASAEDLAGKAGGHAEGSEHNQVVGKVLADALHGGGGHGGPDIETLINSLPGHNGGNGNHGDAALEALASHGAAAVPNGDMGVFAGFSGGHGMHIMEQMQMHQDAAPAHA